MTECGHDFACDCAEADDPEIREAWRAWDEGQSVDPS